MSAALLRFNLSRSSARRSVRGIYLLLDKHILSPSSYHSRNYATNIKTRDDKVKKFTSEDELEILERLKASFKEDESYGEIVPAFKKALLHGNKAAIKDTVGEYTYHRIYVAAKKLAAQISNFCGSGSSSNVAFLCPNNALYPVIQWACWISGQVAVPLSSRQPIELLKYFLEDSNACLIITTPEYESSMKPLAEKLHKILIILEHSFIPEVDPQSSMLDPKNENVLQLSGRLIVEGTLNSPFYSASNAMILYTSGTTASPKGVVLSHRNVSSQVNSLTEAWNFTSKDCLLHVLPLNHVHGCVNALMCPLSVGAKLIMHEKFDSHNVWSTLLGINTPAKDRVNLFMAVPTIYSMLIEEYDKIFAKNSRMIEYIENHCKKNIRLMISGSAPLPVLHFNRWLEISGHKLLERYGMTEIGMALSNPYIEDKTRARKPGTVGLPLPGVEVRIVDNNGQSIYQSQGEYNKGYWSKEPQPVYESRERRKQTAIIGELQVKGPNVFKEYYGKPEQTIKEFDGEYFKTGDTVSFEDGNFKILGRTSSDIIKTGGYKVSALEVETHLLNHPNIKDLAVVGLDDITWGKKVAAVVVIRDNTELDLESLKVFCSERLPIYSIPTILKIVPEIPRNLMGKVNKNDIVSTFFTAKKDENVVAEKAAAAAAVKPNEKCESKV